MCNSDILVGAMLKRAIIDWLVYHDSKDDKKKKIFVSADEFIRYGDFDMYAKCDRSRLLKLLTKKHRKGGYSADSLERAVMRTGDLSFLV